MRDLVAVQDALRDAHPPGWRWTPGSLVAGCFAAPARGHAGPGAAGQPVWAGAAAYRGRRCVGRAARPARAGAGYAFGLLALRFGAVLQAVVAALPERPDVLLVDATGLDHPRRTGLARHLGAVLDVPTVGVTHRTLLARGDWPPDQRGATAPLWLDGELVGHWVRTRSGRRPVAAHAAWRTDAETAARVVLATAGHRTPAPLREARRLARQARAAAASAGYGATRYR
ncbi:hypothetical protein GTS_43180 [Gandjariella thermophila]|uniref:Endonuclease V n=1 Tax=Gandjariella thermophila TaxID=1931992 RepID=A0A4D4J7A9_9PSEU|nr:hypothetical protein GTS_43180 [Gandjariella thermophila]